MPKRKNAKNKIRKPSKKERHGFDWMTVLMGGVLAVLWILVFVGVSLMLPINIGMMREALFYLGFIGIGFVVGKKEKRHTLVYGSLVFYVFLLLMIAFLVGLLSVWKSMGGMGSAAASGINVEFLDMDLSIRFVMMWGGLMAGAYLGGMNGRRNH